MKPIGSRLAVLGVAVVLAGLALVPLAQPAPVCLVQSGSTCAQLPGQIDTVPLAAPDAFNPDWPMYGHDLWGTHFAAGETAINNVTVSMLRAKWTFPIPGGIAGASVVSHGVVYAGAWNGHVYAIDATLGTRLWDTNLGITISSTPAVAGGRVFVATLYPAKLVALDAAHGTVLWSSPIDTIAEGWGSPIVVGDLVLVGQSGGDTGITPPHRGSVQAFESALGNPVWRTYTSPTPGAAVWTTPVVLGNLLFVGTGNDFEWAQDAHSTAMQAINVSTGGIVWYHHFADFGDEDFGASPNLFVTDGRVVLGEAQKEHYHALDPFTGNVYWSRFTDWAWTIGTPAVAYGKIVGVFGAGWYGTHPAMALSERDGTTLWSHASSGGYSAAAVAGHVAFLAEESGAVHGVDIDTGAELWHAQLPSGTTSGPVIAEGKLYMGSGAGVTMFSIA